MEVQTDHLVEPRTAPAAHLPQSGNARPHLQYSPPVPDIINLELIGNRRTGPDEGHFTPQDVPELRKLIEADFPQEFADRGHSRIICNLVDRRLNFVLVRAIFDAGNKLPDVLLVNCRTIILIHGAKLQAFEARSELAKTFLLENHRTFGRQLDDCSNYREHWGQQQQ